MKTIKNYYTQQYGIIPLPTKETSEFVLSAIEGSKGEYQEDYLGGFLYASYINGFQEVLYYATLFEMYGVETKTLKKAMLIAEGMHESNG